MRGERREARGERREPRGESREPRAESREPRTESREPRVGLISPSSSDESCSRGIILFLIGANLAGPPDLADAGLAGAGLAGAGLAGASLAGAGLAGAGLAGAGLVGAGLAGAVDVAGLLGAGFSALGGLALTTPLPGFLAAALFSRDCSVSPWSVSRVLSFTAQPPDFCRNIGAHWKRVREGWE